MPSILSLEWLKQATEQHFFVLDIDSTLVTTHQRNQAILDHFLKSQIDPQHPDALVLAKIRCQLGDYGLHSGLKRQNFQPTESKTLNDLMDYWRQHFFSNEFLHCDQPVAGAVFWTQQLAQNNVPYVFLTARHHTTMWDGTLSSMAQMGFPTTKENLILKEDLSDSDEGYKSKVIAKISKSHDSIILIDNEPVVLNKIEQDHPGVHLVWFDSTHSGKMQPPQNCLTIKDFAF